MKKIMLASLLLFLIAGSQAQDYKKARTIFILSQGSDAKRLEEAKTEFDRVFADAKAQTKAESYALKAEIYGSIAGNEGLRAKYPNAAMEAYEALQKYLQLEPGEKTLKEDGYAGLSGIYNAFYTEGIKFYNEKNWEAALGKFKTLTSITDLYSTRKWSTNPFDTMAYLLAGISAQNAKQNNDAAIYFGKIAEAKLGGKDYEGVYGFLTNHYLAQNDQTNFRKYLSLAKEVYPDITSWDNMEFDYMAENKPVEEVVKKYEEASASNRLTASEYIDYGEYFMNNKKIKEMDDAKKLQFAAKALDAFSKAAAKDTSNGIASFDAGIAAYTLFDNANEQVRKLSGTTPEIKTKRTQAKKEADAAADKTIEWLESSYKTFSAKTNRTATEKNLLNKTVDLLYNLYEYKKDRSRGVNPKDYDKYDAKAKFYDSKHNKF